MPGFGEVSIIPNGKSKVSVDGGSVIARFPSGAYFAEKCIPRVFRNTHYLALNLLGKTFRYTTNLAGAGCGCNVALYLVSMRQNNQPSNWGDYYCDANSVAGVACAEIDIQEANERSWHSTLHGRGDPHGLGSGYGGGGRSWSGPRDFSAAQYSPGSACVDTSKPFDVAVSFPVDAQGNLVSMEVVLSQRDRNCPVKFAVRGYSGNAELTEALRAGMTPVISYWSSDNMLWLDGVGADGKGPCRTDRASGCVGAVPFSNFSVSDIGQQALRVAVKM